MSHFCHKRGGGLGGPRGTVYTYVWQREFSPIFKAFLANYLTAIVKEGNLMVKYTITQAGVQNVAISYIRPPPGIAEEAETFLPREVGRKTENQVCTLSINLESVIIVTLTKKCSNLHSY